MVAISDCFTVQYSGIMSVVCMRCGLMDDYRTEESGPHLKAICNGCDRYIKFLPKPRAAVQTAHKKNMGQIISVRIDVMKIDKARLFVGEKGTYLDITLLMRDQADSYGNHGMVVQQVTKEERLAGTKGPILGNAKIIGQQASESSPQGDAAPSTTQAKEVPQNLPF